MKSKSRLLPLFLCCQFVGGQAQESGLPQQVPDRLVYRGAVFALECNPLESLLRKGAVTSDFVGARTLSASRGYIATFSLPAGRLMLNGLDVFARNYPWLEQAGRAVPGEPGYLMNPALDRYFPRFEDRFLDKFRGILVIDLKDTPLPGKDRDREREKNIRAFRVENGEVVETATMTDDEYQHFRRRQFETFRSTDRYRTFLAKRLHEFDDRDAMDRELFTTDRRFPMEMIIPFAPAGLRDPTGDAIARQRGLYEHR